MLFPLHRILLAVLLLGNAVAFAGVDPIMRLATAFIILVVMIDLRQLPRLPKPVWWAAWVFVALAVVQLIPLPEFVRRIVQPGFRDVMASGWSSLSLAAWSTMLVVASTVLAAGVALVSARMAATRSGLPILLGFLALTCGLVAILGLAGESGAPEKVLLVRANTGGGDAYGPFVNSNHFATAIELSLPAALILLAASLRNLPRPGSTRQRAAVIALGASVISVVAIAAILRSGSRGGVAFLGMGLILTAPLWSGAGRSRRWQWLVAVASVLGVALVLAASRLQALRDGFNALLVLEGVDGNTRWDLWAATLSSFGRSPVIGSGLGSFRFVIGLDRPATGTAVLEQAHNDWLEIVSTGGLVGLVALVFLIVGVVAAFRFASRRNLRFELRYPLAGAAAALVATGLHETVGFGLQTPLNRYLLAVWIGLVWGIGNRVRESGAGEKGSRGAEEQRSRGAEEQRSRGAEEQRRHGSYHERRPRCGSPFLPFSLSPFLPAPPPR